MELHGNGGPPQGALHPWTDGWQTVKQNPQQPKDRTVYRTPENRALQQCKNEIQKEEQWDDFKKITNPYEYVFLSWNRRTSRSVCLRQPLSRSYFKMVELWHVEGVEACLEQLVKKDKVLLTAHAAEGPGGFIEACWKKAESMRWKIDRSFAITLRSEAKNVPGWRKAVKFLQDHPQVQISNGHDGTGNILLLENQEFYIRQVREAYPQGVHLYTADGGFDFSLDYNSQEDTIFPLFLAESLLGIQVLQEGGCLCIKCFDTIERPTLDLLWLLSRCFREWSLVKPKTSRAGNAERYFLGKGFLGGMEDIRDLLLNVQATQNWTQPILCWPEQDPAYKDWLQSVLHFQELIEHQEYEVIRATLDLIHGYDFSKIRSLVRENVERSVRWCEDYGEPISTNWVAEQDKTIQKETQDLMHILSPEKSTQFHGHSWYNRTSTVTTATSSLSFEGFRSMRATSIDEPAPPANPFVRYASIFRT